MNPVGVTKIMAVKTLTAIVLLFAAASATSVSAAAFISALASFVSATAAAASSASVSGKFAMQSFGEFLFSGFAHFRHFYREVEGLPGHRVIEVHDNDVRLDFHHFAMHDLAAVVHHRNHVAYEKNVFAYDTVAFEYFLGKFHYRFRFRYSVALFRGEREFDFVSYGFPFEVGLEFWKQHPFAENEVQRFFRGCLVGYLSVYCKCVVY